MAPTVTLTAARAYPESVGRVFDLLLPLPLPRLFARRYAAIPPITSVSGQSGVWGSVGQTRTIHLAGGGTMGEMLTEVVPPGSLADETDPGGHFDYTITGITGPLAPLVEHAVGRWHVGAVGTGARVTWQWTVTPGSRAAAVVMPAFGRMWGGYARLALEELEHLLLPS